jgi:hypothetical protein
MSFVRYTPRPLDDACTPIAVLDDRIIGVALVENGKLAGTCLRQGFPVPSQDKLELMLMQARIISGVTKTAEDYHGRLSHIALYYEGIEQFIFVLGEKKILIVSALPDAVDRALVGNIARRISQVPGLEG